MEPERWGEIDRLYHAALERASGDRAKFLAHECNDEQLRHEVESLLQYTEQGDRFLENQPWTSASTSGELPFERIGPYRLEGVLGKGGMGVVYRATDTKLNRPAAIKVLTSALATASVRHRFEREARMASALNHPHILTVYDAGELDGRQYLVTEYVDGGTLRNWAQTEPRTWQTTVELLMGIGDALACAHEAGILHRDIKPDNILISKSGYAKLADFGLAKLFEVESGEETQTATNPGVVVGTVAYMSPEQASGRAVDARSDIFSFGLVLYEMLAGHRAFSGASSLEVMQKIIHGKPEPLNDRLPPELRNAIAKALANQPAQRYQSVRELLADLKKLIREPQPVAIVRSALSWPKYLTGAFVFALAVAGAMWMSRSKPVPLPPKSEYVQLTNFTDSASAPALSPDGKMVAFLRGGGQFFQSRGQVYVKVLPNGAPVQLTNEADLKYGVVFTPDESRVAYTLLKLGGSWDTWTVPILGGAPTRFLPNASGLTWLDDRRVIFSEIMAGTGAHMGIVTANEDRSGEQTLYFPDHDRAMAHYSYPSPDRKQALVVEMNETTAWQQCRLLPLYGGKGGKIGPAGACIAAAWSPKGDWAYFNVLIDGAWHIWRQRFPNGTPEQITFGPTEEQGIAIAPDGRSLITSVGKRYSTIWLHDSSGDRAISAEAFAFAPQLSSDGKRVYFQQRQSPASPALQSSNPERSSPFGPGTGELWSLDLVSGKSEPLLSDIFIANYSVSSDGKEIVFTTLKDGAPKIWLAPADRHAPPRMLAPGGGALFGKDGTFVYSGGEKGNSYLYRMNRDGTGNERISDTHSIGGAGSVSPDGEWVADLVPGAGGETNWEATAFQIRGKGTKSICKFFCAMRWSQNGKFMYLDLDISQTAPTGVTFSVPLATGSVFPDLPPGGLKSPQEIAKLPGAKLIPRSAIFPGAEPSVYVFTKQGFDGNLFRVALPE